MKNMKVLVVDDEPNILTLFSFMLKQAGYQVDAASCAQEALAQLKENEYHVMLSDIMMPGIDGLELLELVKKDYPKMQVIMITAVSTIKTAEKALENGAFGFLAKPIKKQEVLKTVEHAIKKHVDLNENIEKADKKADKSEKIVVYSLLIADYEGRIQRVNKAFEAMLGYGEGELTGESVRNVFCKDVAVGDKFQEIPEKLKVEDFEMCLITKLKQDITFSFNGTIMNDSKRKVIGFVGVLENG
jgi:PAS domain S-box-containing protein